LRTRFRYTPDIPLPQPTRTGEPIWLDPYPDELLGDIPDTAPGPKARYEARESVSLAFVTALQHLTPGQRTALVLRDVLGFSAAETADILGASLDAVNGALKRARAVIAEHLPPGQHDQAPLPGSAGERRIVARFADAFEHGDVANIVDLLTGDAWLTMPPLPFQYQGRAAAAEFLSAISFRGGSRQFRLVPTPGQRPARLRLLPARRPGADRPRPRADRAHLAGDRISAVTRFLDNSVLPQFGLPRTLPE